MPNIAKSYNEDVVTVSKVSISILSPQEILKYSCCEIDNPFDQKTFVGTLSDPKMGPINSDTMCKLCGYGFRDCPGHFGHIKLAKPMFNIVYFKAVIKILGLFCHDPNCASLLITPSFKGSNKTRFNTAVKMAKTVTACPICEKPTRKYKKIIDKTYLCIKSEPKKVDKEKDNSNTLVASDVLRLFSRISDDDCLAIGLNPATSRPEWMIFTYLPVAPPTVRPTVKTDSGKSSDDDLTLKYNDIIKCNNKLLAHLKSGEADGSAGNATIDEKQLQYNIITLVDNNTSGLPKAVHKNGGRPLKSFRERAGGKEGRFRSHLMGKRVDGSARSVISCNHLLSIDEVGVPEEVCRNLTYPEKVTPYNIHFLNKMMKENRVKSVLKKSQSKKINLAFTKKEVRLAYGDIVYRHLMDGDMAIFNRQPSLHKMSIMAHKIKVIKNDKTLQMNPNVTGPYNADFDGDEMNLHLPQNYETVAELKYIVNVSNQIVSAQSSAPVIGLVQDSLLGAYLLAKEKEISYGDYMSITKRCYGFNKNYVKLPPITNRHQLNALKVQVCDILSGIMPPINYTSDKLVINNGKVSSEKYALDKKSLGTGAGGLIHIIFNDCGPEFAKDFINNIGILAIDWLAIIGFSCGLSDCFIDQKIMNANSNTINEQLKESYEFIERVKANSKDEYECVIDNDCYIKKILGIVGKARKITEEATVSAISESEKTNPNSLYRGNSTFKMIDCGSKGKPANINQIITLLGQQLVDGTWIVDQLFGRTLPHYAKFNMLAESHGFVTNSYVSGLNPFEYWYHAGSGREGVISKTIKTSETGYIQRRFEKILENLRLAYDGTVRNENNIIIQNIYGNGFDPTFNEHQSASFVNFSKTRLAYMCEYNDHDYAILNKILTVDWNPDSHAKILIQHEFDRLYEETRELKKEMFMGADKPTLQYPVNVSRTVDNFIDKFLIKDTDPVDITPEEIINSVNQLCDSLQVCRNKKVSDKVLAPYKTLLRLHLNSKYLILKRRISKVAFESLVTHLQYKLTEYIVNPGENVGTLGAQSLGEPTTQLSLDTFHNIGFDDEPKGGVQRLRDCMAITRNSKTPYSIVGMNDSITEETCKSISENIKFVSFKNIINNIKFVIEGVRIYCYIEYNKSMIASIKPIHFVKFFQTHGGKKVFSPSTNVDNLISSDKILIKIAGNTSVIIPDEDADDTDANVSSMTINANEEDNLETIIEKFKTVLLDTSIKGLKGIDKTYYKKIEKEVLIDGEYVTRIDKQYIEYFKMNDESNKDKRYKEDEKNISYEIRTTGCNIYELLHVIGSDPNKFYSNNFWEMYAFYGIEVARECLIREVDLLLGGSTNRVHSTILADGMTSEGWLISVDRHGVNKSEAGILGRATFEETVTQLVNGAIYNDIDNMTGVSSNVMFGQFVPMGTSAFKLELDFDKTIEMKTYDPPINTFHLDVDEAGDVIIDRSLFEFDYIFY